MATSSSYLGLTLPVVTEYYDLGVWVENMNTIDTFAANISAAVDNLNDIVDKTNDIEDVENDSFTKTFLSASVCGASCMVCLAYENADDESHGWTKVATGLPHFTAPLYWQVADAAGGFWEIEITNNGALYLKNIVVSDVAAGVKITLSYLGV